MKNLNLFEEDIEHCLTTLADGGTILYPTDTIWGIGCDATNIRAIEKVYQIKKRPKNNPFIILVSSVAMLLKYADDVPEMIFDFLENVKEPTTIIYPKSKNLPEEVCNIDGSIAIRVCNEPFCKSLISTFRKPIVSTSANISNEPSPKNFKEISNYIKNQVDYIVKYRQNDITEAKPSAIYKLIDNNRLEKIR